MTKKERVRIVYDGECPFCGNYVSLLQLRENFDVELVDARTVPDVVAELAAKNFDLSEGMIAEFANTTYYGADAIHALSVASSRKGGLNKVLGTVFRNRTLARGLYPAMKLGRRLTLALLGKSVGL